MIKSAQLAWSILRGSVADNWNRNVNPPRWNAADDQLRKLLKQVWDEGYVVVPGFLDEQTCDAMKDEVDHLLDEHADKAQVTSEGADHRLFGVERVSPTLNQFWEHPMLVQAFQIYCKPEQVTGFTMANRITASENNLGSGNGWHRDTASSRQFKSILYLTDVADENGPFQYLRKSHTPWSRVWTSMEFKTLFRERRYDTDELTELLDSCQQQIVTLTAPKGTLILADTSGIHRGKPLISGCRYALTNYFMNDSISPQIRSMLIDAPSST